MTYALTETGERIEIPRRRIRLRCCDCGLVHLFVFRVEKSGRLSFQAYRDYRATGQSRRHRKREVSVWKPSHQRR